MVNLQIVTAFTSVNTSLMDYTAAFVIWMKTDSIAVVCPLCSKVEVHSYQFQDGQINKSKPTIFDAKCSPSGATYKAIFPWQIGLAMEKNWAGGRLDVVGLELHGLEIEGACDPATFEILAFSIGEKVTEKTYKGGNPNGTSPFGPTVDISPRLHLGDLTKMSVVAVKRNKIEIRAPFATINGVLFSGPLGVLQADRSLFRKTIGVLVREGPFTPVIAASGWKDCFINTKNTLKQKLWVGEVFKLCSYVGHELGQVRASHVEKQLIAFAIRTHYFLEDEPVYMYKLKELPSKVPELWIVVDNDPCEDCDLFRKKVEAVCKTKIHYVRMERKNEYEIFIDGHNILEPKTPTKTKPDAFPLLTPPDFNNQFSEYNLSDSDDDEYFEDDESEDDLPSSEVRNLRFLGTPQRPITIQHSPPLSPTMRSSRKLGRSNRMEVLPAQSQQSRQEASSLYSARRIPSKEEITAAITEVYDSMTLDGNETEEEFEEILEEKRIIDLTLDNSTYDDDSEGSIFYPDTE